MLRPVEGEAPFVVTDPVECAVRSAPASTFKIPHALIALETGVVADGSTVLAWDGTPQPFPSWERNHSLESAIRSSVVWFFRRTAALIGRERMLQYLRRLDYASDTFEDDVTSFWLNGDLVVSPEEQLRFMRRLMRDELPVSRDHVETVRTALRMPPDSLTNASGRHDFMLGWRGPVVVRAKTGFTSVGDERVAWLVGHIETSSREYVFASRVRSAGALAGTAAIDLARRVLAGHGSAER
jgi:beta-lactamase class D